MIIKNFKFPKDHPLRQLYGNIERIELGYENGKFCYNFIYKKLKEK